MLASLLQGTPPRWPASAVHDTVAAIARGLEYRRSLRQSVLDRLLLWFGELLDRLFGAVRHMPSARTIGLVVLGLIVALIVGRILIAAFARDETGNHARRLRRHP